MSYYIKKNFFRNNEVHFMRENIWGTVIFIELQNSFLTLKAPSCDSTPWLLNSNSINNSPLIDFMTNFFSHLESIPSQVKKKLKNIFF